MRWSIKTRDPITSPWMITDFRLSPGMLHLEGGLSAHCTLFVNPEVLGTSKDQTPDLAHTHTHTHTALCNSYSFVSTPIRCSLLIGLSWELRKTVYYVVLSLNLTIFLSFYLSFFLSVSLPLLLVSFSFPFFFSFYGSWIGELQWASCRLQRVRTLKKVLFFFFSALNGKPHAYTKRKSLTQGRHCHNM